MDESSPLLLVEVVVGVGENEPDRGKEVGLTGTVSANHHVEPWRERVDLDQVFVRLESLDSNLG